MFTEIFPIISTRDLEGALGSTGTCSGDGEHEFPGPDGKPAYVGLELGGAHLGIGSDPDAPSEPSARFSLWAYADDCDAAVERLRASAVEIVEEPADQPWGERVARVRDPDGNLVLIGQRSP